MTIIFGEGDGQTGGDHKDTQLISGVFSANSYAGTEYLTLRNIATQKRYGILRYSYSGHGIPSADSIISATFTPTLAYMNGVTVDATCNVHRLTTQWGKTYTDGGATESPATDAQATHDNAYDRDNPALDTGWAAGVGAGFGSGDYVSPAEGSFVLRTTDSIGTEYEVDVTDAVKAQFASEAANAGFALVLPQQVASGNIWGLGSFDNPTAAYRHKLTINYTVPQDGDCGMHVDMSMGM